MLAAQETAQNANSIGIVVVLLATMLVVFWRTVIKLALSILAIAVLAMMSFAAIELWQSVHHVVK